MPYQELPGLGMRGLNTDTPPQALDHTQFSAGLNMRPFDGSLQQVYGFLNEINDDLAGTDTGTRAIYAAAQWTSSGEQSLNVAYLYDDANNENINNDGINLRLQVVEDITGDATELTGAVAATTLDTGSRFGVDMFAFNDLLIINDGINHPVSVAKDETNDIYTATLLERWPSGQVANFSAVQGNTPYYVLRTETTNRDYWLQFADASAYQWLHGGDSPEDEDDTPVIGQRFISKTTPAVDPINGSSITLNFIGTPIAAQRIVPFGTRLVAMNISEEYLADENFGNNTVLFSSPITGLGTLEGIEWVAGSNNVASDDIVTETSGEIIDGLALGQYFILYKTDGIYRYIDTGEPLYVVGEPLTTDDGIYGPDCVVDIGAGRHLVMGNYGVYIHDGGPNKQNISRSRIEKYLYSRVLQQYRNNVFLFHHRADKEVWICYPHIQEWRSDVSYPTSEGRDDSFEPYVSRDGRIFAAWQPYPSLYEDQIWAAGTTYEYGDIVIYPAADGVSHVYELGESESAWDPNAPHDEGDIVSFESDHYQALQNIAAIPQWDEDTTYNSGDIVVDGNPHIVYVANTTTIGTSPAEDPDWDVTDTRDPDNDTANWQLFRSTGDTPGDDNDWVDLNVDFTNTGKDPLTTSVKPSDSGFDFDNKAASFYWVEILGSGCNFALVYNYEHDTWYERSLPLTIHNQTKQSDDVYVDADFRGDGLRGLTLTELNGSLIIFGWGDEGFWNLRTERPNDQIENNTNASDYGNIADNASGAMTIPGSIELHYLPFGQNSMVKHLHAAYPHTTGQVNVNIETTNNLGISGEPDFANGDRLFNAESQDVYKLDYRIHGRYYHIKISSVVESDGSLTNPSLTGIGFEMKLGGQR